jgi:hypothetical protein
MGAPQRNKKLLRCELVQEGSCALLVYVNPSITTEAVLGPPTISGTTFGIQRVPLGVLGPGIALTVWSRHRGGHLLDAIGIDYVLRNR